MFVRSLRLCMCIFTDCTTRNRKPTNAFLFAILFTHVDFGFPGCPDNLHVTLLITFCLFLFSLTFHSRITNAMDVDPHTESYDIALGYRRSLEFV
jgi:hypothetical protein